MYKLLRNILFLLPPEMVHYLSMDLLELVCSIPLARKWLTSHFRPASGELNVFGLSFKNRVGLAAGFDKNAKYLRSLKTLGFGFVEIGTVTPQPQSGNEKPRLFRLTKDQALLNRMGFNNEGVKKVSERLKKWKERSNRGEYAANPASMPGAEPDLLIGGNIGKNKSTANEDAWKDYDICFRELFDCVDYFVVNVSSPNTPGLRELQEKDSLKKILSHLQLLNAQKTNPKPILLKIAPDLTLQQLDDVVELALEIKLNGLVATNTTISRDYLSMGEAIVQQMGAGGISGKPLGPRSTEIVSYIHKKSGGMVPVIASGGIFTGFDALEKLHAGATLLQVWTGFIYEGPGIVKKILAALPFGDRPPDKG